MISHSSRVSTLVATVLALAAPSLALSQDLPERSGGIWWEAFAGAGGARLTCDICDPTRQLGPTVGGALGSYATPRVRIGIELGVVGHEDGDVRESVYEAGLTTSLYPRPGSGLHLVAGLGWSGYRAEAFHYDGVHVKLGAGWDLPLVGSWVVGNRLTVDASSWAALENREDDVAIASPVGLSVLRLAVYVRRR